MCDCNDTYVVILGWEIVHECNVCTYYHDSSYVNVSGYTSMIVLDVIKSVVVKSTTYIALYICNSP